MYQAVIVGALAHIGYFAHIGVLAQKGVRKKKEFAQVSLGSPRPLLCDDPG